MVGDNQVSVKISNPYWFAFEFFSQVSFDINSDFKINPELDWNSNDHGWYGMYIRGRTRTNGTICVADYVYNPYNALFYYAMNYHTAEDYENNLGFQKLLNSIPRYHKVGTDIIRYSNI